MSSKQVLIMVAPLCVLVIVAVALALLTDPAAIGEPIQAVPLSTLSVEETVATPAVQPKPGGTSLVVGSGHHDHPAQ